jgi:hypothetical protein
MKPFLLPLTILLFATATQAVANYAAVNRNPSELHAAVTDIPLAVDLSHADPLTWHSAPGPVEVKIRPRNDGPSCIMFNAGLQAAE